MDENMGIPGRVQGKPLATVRKRADIGPFAGMDPQMIESDTRRCKPACTAFERTQEGPFSRMGANMGIPV